jgi:acyl phosphate:glycerol-3-phosphate acyltransferase
MMVLIALAAGYLIGSVPFGYLAGRARGVDVRKSGSGNIGATNVLRVLGRKWGLLVFACDVLKGFISVRLAMWYGQSLLRSDLSAYSHWFPSTLAIAAGIGCILGHTFTFWLGFKGGKGVATSAGVLLGLMPLVTLCLVSVWALVFFTTRYVSLASLVVAILLPIAVLLRMLAGGGRDWPTFYFSIAIMLLVIVRHRANIQRLIAGTENRFERPSN